MFTTEISHNTLTFRIDSGLIEIGSTNWQTKNISSVSIDQERLRFSEPEPKLTEPKPKPKTGWGLLLLGIAASWTMALNADRVALVGMILSLMTAFVVWFIRHYGYKNSLRIWKKRTEDVSAAHSTWKRLSSTVPTVFNLILESSSGRAVALSTFEKDSLLNVHNAILQALRGSAITAVTGSIRTIHTGSGPVQKQYEAFCSKEISSTLLPVRNDA